MNNTHQSAYDASTSHESTIHPSGQDVEVNGTTPTNPAVRLAEAPDTTQRVQDPSSVFQRSEIAPGDLLKYKPGQDFDSYLNQRTRGRFVTPDSGEDAIADAIAKVARPVLRYIADYGTWVVWDGNAWNERPGAANTTIKALLHRTFPVGGSPIPPRIQPCAVVSEKKQPAALMEAIDAGIAEQRGDTVYYTGTLQRYIPYAPVPLEKVTTDRLMKALCRHLEATTDLYTREDAWDQHPEILAMEGSYMNLDTLDTTSPDPDLLLTRRTTCAPAVQVFSDMEQDEALALKENYSHRFANSAWAQFLETTMPDPEMRKYLQTIIGVSLHGGVDVQNLYVLTGKGANGKGVLLQVLQDVFGPLAVSLPDTVVQSHGEQHPTELMGLKGARIGVISETKEGMGWNVSQLKRLTGGDAITAHRMRQDFETFKPTHTLFIASNSRPTVGAGEQAFWRRYREVDFPTTFVTEDRDLEEGEVRADETLVSRLSQEKDIILQWCIDGWLQYKADGKISEPAQVLNAVKQARATSSGFSAFVGECFETTGNPADQVTNSEFYALWKAYKATQTSSPRERPNRINDLSDKVTKEIPSVEYVDREKIGNNRGSTHYTGLVITEAALPIVEDALDPAGLQRREPTLTASEMKSLREIKDNLGC